MAKCNVCGGHDFEVRGDRQFAKCRKCGATERARLVHLIFDHTDLLIPGKRMLHLAPERNISKRVQQVLAQGYEMADYDPSLFPWATQMRTIDLTKDVEALPSSHYDIVLHLHVMEHIPCNITSVLFHLHRSLKPGGIHIFAIPIMSGGYEETLAPLGRDQAQARFGQHDHLRRFSAEDIPRTLGMIFDLPDTYDLTNVVPEARLMELGFTPEFYRGWSGSSIFMVRREGLKLDPARYLSTSMEAAN